jgi:hypothetical protein
VGVNDTFIVEAMMTHGRGKSIAILQSNYIPWKGYFDIIAAVDEFVIFDEVQFTRRDWRNRNRIVNHGRIQWLTIPVATKGAFDSAVCDIEVVASDWADRHWSTLRHAYGKAPHFHHYAPALERAYAEAARLTLLSAINRHFLKTLCQFLDLATPLLSSSDVPREAANPTARLVEICKARRADRYVSGPAARAYIDPAMFSTAGIALAYADYAGYPTYVQGTAAFEHGVSMLDVLMRLGPDSRRHLKSLRPGAEFLEPAEV